MTDDDQEQEGRVVRISGTSHGTSNDGPSREGEGEPTEGERDDGKE